MMSLHKHTWTVHKGKMCTIYLQLMFTQSVVVRGSGFPLLAIYVAVIKAAWREVTISLKEKKTSYFTSAQLHVDIDQT